PTFQNVDVVGSTLGAASSMGGGFYVGAGASLSLDDSTVAYISLAGSRAYGGAIFAATGASVSVTFSDFYEDGADPFDWIAEPSAAHGNLAIDPGYVNVSGDVSTWDLTLGAGSGLIDAGSPDLLDADGSPCDVGGYGGPSGAW